MLGTRFVLFSLAALVVTSIVPVATLHFSHDPDILHPWAVVTFLADLIAVAGIVLGLGYAVTGRVAGIALSGYNDFSLAKLQMAMWTIVVLAALLTTARLNLLGYFGPMPPSAVVVDNTPGEAGQGEAVQAGSGAPAEPHGINLEGLKRRGFEADTLASLRQVYRLLYRQQLSFQDAKAAIAGLASHADVKSQQALRVFSDFLTAASRGVIR